MTDENYTNASLYQPYGEWIPPKPVEKKRITAGLLGIFLGVFGVHNFYLGYTGKAMAQLMITVFSLFTLGLISWIWGLVEGIRCLADQGILDAFDRPLR